MHERVQELRRHRATGTASPTNFTEDAEYVEHAFGTFRGRDEIREPGRCRR